MGGCINLVLDPILIISCNMGVAGAAAATLFSQIVSSALYICFLVRGKSYLKISLGRFKPDKVVYTEVLKIGFPVCMFQFLTGGALSICRQGLFFIPFPVYEYMGINRTDPGTACGRSMCNLRYGCAVEKRKGDKVKWIINNIKNKKKYRNNDNPKYFTPISLRSHFDFNLIF